MSGYSSALVIDMAKIKMEGLDEYGEKLSQLGLRAEGVIKFAVYPGAAIIIEAIKAGNNEKALEYLEKDNGRIEKALSD